MIYNDEENQYNDVVGILKQLPNVNAPALFEADLMRRINSGKLEKENKQTFWEKLLSPYRLFPSAAVAVAAILVLFIVDTSSVEYDDPLSVEPRVREDMIQSSGTADISIDDEMGRIAKENDDNFLRRESLPQTGRNDEDISTSQQSSAATFTSTSYNIKNGLNFRQINLSKEEREKLNKLKEQIKQYFQNQEQINK